MVLLVKTKNGVEALTKIIFDTMEISERKRAEEFFEITSIVRKTYYDMRKAKPDYCPADRTIVAICAALDLDVTICEKLFEAGRKNLGYCDEHWAFRLILTACRGWNLTRRNDYLEALGYGRLTDDK